MTFKATSLSCIATWKVALDIFEPNCKITVSHPAVGLRVSHPAVGLRELLCAKVIPCGLRHAGLDENEEAEAAIMAGTAYVAPNKCGLRPLESLWSITHTGNVLRALEAVGSAAMG